MSSALPSADRTHSAATPLLTALGCYVAWGIFPLYWKMLGHLSALETLAHRFFWSFFFYLGFYVVMHHMGRLNLVRATRRDWLMSGLASLMLAVNWGVFIYAINTHRVLESSLAYFINPLLSVGIGVWLFGEPFPKLLRFAVIMALLGLLIKASFSHTLPWISVALALSFCFYGLVKKTTAIGVAQFSLMEGTVALIPAAILAITMRHDAHTSLQAMDWWLLMSAGIVTGIPLLLFAFAAQTLPYTMLGILQFVVPSLQFAISILAFNETLHTPDLVAFGCIWIGVGCYLAHKCQRLTR